MLNNVGDNAYPTQNSSMSNARMAIDYNGNGGIGNTSPWTEVNVGDRSVSGSSGHIFFLVKTVVGVIETFIWV